MFGIVLRIEQSPASSTFVIWDTRIAMWTAILGPQSLSLSELFGIPRGSGEAVASERAVIRPRIAEHGGYPVLRYKPTTRTSGREWNGGELQLQVEDVTPSGFL